MTFIDARRAAPNRKVDPDRLAALVRGGSPLRRVAAELAVSRRTVRDWQTRLGLPVAAPSANRKVDPDGFAALAALGYPLNRIAATLGVSDTAARDWRDRLGLRAAVAPPAPTRAALGPAERAAIAASNNHAETARELGVSGSTFRVWRRRMGLPALPESEKVARRTRGIRARCGATRGLARGYGLPADLSPLELSVLLALLGGPLTRSEVSAAVGPGVNSGEHDLYAVVRRGLVAAARDGNRRRYCLTAAALDMIAADGEASQ